MSETTLSKRKWQTLTVWEGGSESGSTNWRVGDELNPQNVTNHRGVVRGERVSTEAADQGASGVALSDFQVVILTASVSLQVKETEQKTRPLLIFSTEVSFEYKS